MTAATTNGRFLTADGNNAISLLSASSLSTMIYENGIVYDDVMENCASKPAVAYFPIETRSSWFTVIIRGQNNVDNLTVHNGNGDLVTLTDSNIVFRDNNLAILKFYRSKMDQKTYVGHWKIETFSSCIGGAFKCGCQIQARVSSPLEAQVGFTANQHDDFVERTPFSSGAANRSIFFTGQVTNSLLANADATLTEVILSERSLAQTNTRQIINAQFISRDNNTCSNQFVTSEQIYPEGDHLFQYHVVTVNGFDEYGQPFKRIQTFSNTKSDCGTFGHPDTYGQCVCKANYQGFDCRTPICVNGGTADLSVCNCRSGFYGDFCQKRVLHTPGSSTTQAPFTTSSSSSSGLKA
ncbi:hypothetical protein L596_015160 [Steinernema carpocapsae]|uniref:EGF-like domain-containing protein n=1 Tax=Steinernema carpocapsae TaxID=34508 RepID=A0A4U5NE61_STECR|nr:hypothetical protein L596_015160 [Steinernema carpocapsae]